MGRSIQAEAIIFDCDGTLVDSETLSTRLILQMLKERDNHPTYEDIFNIFRGEKFSIFFLKNVCVKNHWGEEKRTLVTEFFDFWKEIFDCEDPMNLLKKIFCEELINFNYFEKKNFFIKI